MEDQLRIIAFEKDVAWLTGARAKEARAIRRQTFNLTGFIHGLRNGRVVVLHCVLSQLQSIQAADRLVPSGPVEHDIVHVVAPCKKRLKNAGSNKAAPAWAQCDFWNPWVSPPHLTVKSNSAGIKNPLFSHTLPFSALVCLFVPCRFILWSKWTFIRTLCCCCSCLRKRSFHEHNSLLPADLQTYLVHGQKTVYLQYHSSHRQLRDVRQPAHYFIRFTLWISHISEGPQ